MRIAQIIGRLSIGGAEKHFVELINAMNCDSRAAIFVSKPGTGPPLDSQLDPEVRQYAIRIRKRSLPLGIFRLARLLRRIRCDVVHTHMFWANLYGCIAARLAGVPVVVTTEHGEDRWKTGYARWLERRVISPLVDARFCVSRNILLQRRDVDGVPPDKLHVTVNGTSIPDEVRSSAISDVLTIGTVGRFVTQKDYPMLVQAAAKLRDRGFEFRTYLVGDGPEMSRVLDTIKRYSLEDVVKLPGLDPDIDRWYRRFDIYVSSSAEEGQPVSLLEAMAFGLPVVVTDVGAISQTVANGKEGIVVPPGEPALLADALAELLRDKSLRGRLGQAARNRVIRDFSIEAVAQRYQRYYLSVLSRKRKETGVGP